MVESVPAIVFTCESGQDGAWTYVNRWIEPILGFTPDEWLGVPGIWERQVHPDDRAHVFAIEEAEVQAMREGNVKDAPEGPGSFYLDYRMLHKDGHTVWIRDSSMLVRAADGSLHWHGVLLDITDQKQVEQQLERRSAAQAAVARLGEHALAGADIQDLLEEACRTATEVLGVESAVAAQIGENRSSLHVLAEHGWLTPEHLRHQDTLDPGSPTDYMLRTGKPLLVQDWDREDRFERTKRVDEQGIRSSIGTRIEGGVHPWGVFRVFSSTPHAFAEADVDFVVSVANILADAIERQDAEDAIKHRALHDPLTALPNRVLFTDRLEQALERARRHAGSLAAVLFIDVDHFKQVNDTLGHQAGDDLLIGVATRLREAVRPTDTVARFGGDEFGLLVEEIASERDAIATAERIAAAFARPFVLDASSQFVTASIGIALAGGYENAQSLLRDADAAMYRAKQRGRARYDLFDEDLRVRALARGRMENDLRRAVEFRELRVDYQPVIRLRDDAIVGFEALLRWDHPQRGPVPPTEFIPIAEESGLIDRIGEWVLEEALHEVSRWAAQRPDKPTPRIGINISTHQLQNPRFAETLRSTLATTGVDPDCVRIEIGERVLREGAEQTRKVLRGLKSLGVRLVIDDFGTGQSSLSELAELPIDTIKVDRRYVGKLAQDAGAGRIAQAVIATGLALGLGVVGAGVETEVQLEQLRRLGAEGAQGFLFSPAVSADEAATLLAESDRTGGNGRTGRTG